MRSALLSTLLLAALGCKIDDGNTHYAESKCRTASDKAKNAVAAFGFTQVCFGTPSFFECGDSDSWTASYSFAAINAQGQPVQGTVCCAHFSKGCTLRF